MGKNKALGELKGKVLYVNLNTNTMFFFQPPQYGDPGWDAWWSTFNSGFDAGFEEEPDLECHENIPSGEEEEGEVPRTPGKETPEPSQSSKFSATPPKAKRSKTADGPEDFPEELFPFLSQAVLGNKCYQAFAIYTTEEKSKQLYSEVEIKFNCSYSAVFLCNDGSGGIVFMLTTGKHRVSAVTNFCKSKSSISFIICKACLKPYEMYVTLMGPGFQFVEESKAGGLHGYDFEDPNKREDTCNWNLVADFAVQEEISDPLLVMGLYLDFACNPDTCSKCKTAKHRLHYGNHKNHFQNAKLFLASKNQKGIAQQATDRYLATKRVRSLEWTREEILVAAFKRQFQWMDENLHGGIAITQEIAAVCWMTHILPDFTGKVKEILKLIVQNCPKKRNVLFRGPLNSGKTTLAAALLDLCGGSTLNVNCPGEKLPFELGCAMDKFMCCFEDVKGTPIEGSGLPPGPGMSNLDNLRDHLDGAVKVNLEKKHQNKVPQIFPPCIVTTNDYCIPKSLRVRFARTYQFFNKKFLKESAEKSGDLLRKRMLQAGHTLLSCLVWWEPVGDFHPDLQEQVVKWKQIFEVWVPFSLYCTMKQNIAEGEDPLKGILLDEGDLPSDGGEGPSSSGETPNETQDSNETIA